jgi:hypothetical protein
MAAGAVWVAVTAVLARQELLAAGDALAPGLQSAGRPEPGAADGVNRLRGAGLSSRLRAAAAHADRARFYTSGPAWYAAAHVPVLGGPARTVRGAAAVTDRVTSRVLPPLAHLAARLAGAPGQHDGSLVDLSALRRSAPALEDAARAASLARAEAAALPRSTWLPAADRARAQLAGQVDRIASAAADAAAAARVAPPMLGEREPRRYLVVFHNTAEARGTGGLPGAFAVLAADRGRLRFESFADDTTVARARAGVALGEDYDAAYAHNGPARTWVNANLSPHFPYAARIWADAWRRHSGQQVDGVIALDPGAMAGLLSVAGPARLADGTAVSAANAVELTQSRSYALFSDNMQRKAFLLQVARATAERLLSAAGDRRRLPALMGAANREMHRGRAMVWSSRPAEQRVLQRRGFAGALPDGQGPFAGLVVNNSAGTKLDYYLHRSLQWQPGRCVRDGREVTVTVVLASRAPASGLPRYVTQRLDKPPYRTRPGDNRLMVSYFASHGARLTGMSLDGRQVLPVSATERGHPVYTVDVELPAQATRTLRLRLVEPRSARPAVLLRQPLAKPLHAVVRPYPAC